jgi:hypothetical protein
MALTTEQRQEDIRLRDLNFPLEHHLHNAS